MAWSPTDTNLGTYNELSDVSETITYTDGGTSYTVTLTPQQTDPTTLTLSNDDPATITGYYDNVFTDTIQYRTINDTFVDVTSFSDIDLDELSEMIYYVPESTTSRTYSYLATADGQSKTYTITINNDWDAGKFLLKSYVKRTVPSGIVWINSSAETVTWLNARGQEVTWE